MQAVAKDANSIPEWGRSPGGGNGNLLLYSCLENPLDRGVWQAAVHGVIKSELQTRLSTCTYTHEKKEENPSYNSTVV